MRYAVQSGSVHSRMWVRLAAMVKRRLAGSVELCFGYLRWYAKAAKYYRLHVQ